MRLSLAPLLAATILAGCATAPAAVAPIPTMAPRFTTTPLPDAIPSDLPRSARPLNYAISIQPDAAALSFSGSSVVTFELFEPVDTLALHALDLNIDEAWLETANGSRAILSTRYQPEQQTVQLRAGSTMQPGTYRLGTSYTGVIATQAAGLFALDYPDKRTGEQVRGLFTQFEAPDARRFAPMFDEPSYKATFDLTAIVPAAQMAISNMPITSETPAGDGMKRVTFATSPTMSSYLLFFALGDFERATALAAEGTELGIVAPAGSGEQARFALDSMVPLIPWFEDYFGTQYPLPKLDNVAAPGSSQFFGAMENWGAILTFESLLLNDPAVTTPARRRQIFETQAHEVAHQWFGNIVTMAWWDDLWLNEGFASWLDTKVTHHFHPEWQQNLRRVDVRERAIGLDGYANTHPVIQNISTVSELAQAFDAIAYSKGESVIAMLETYAGEAVWQDGLRRYLARHAWGNTRSIDLWTAMEEAGASGLTAIAEDFTTQPGVPLVSASAACVDGHTILNLSQSEFSLDRREAAAASPQRWLVPLRIASGDQPVRPHLLEGSAQLTFAGCSDPVVINSGQTGYFRTQYDSALAARAKAGFAAFAPIDQLGLLRDGFSLADNGYQAIDPALALLEAVPADSNPVLAAYAVDRWTTLYERLGEERLAERATIAAIASQRWGARLNALGFDAVDGEPLVDTDLRVTLIDALGRMGDARVADEARRRFAMLANDPRALDGPLKTTWLGIATAGAGQSEWDLLKRLAEQSTSTGERQLYYGLLGATIDQSLAQQALDFALTGAAGTSSSQIIDRVSGRYPELAFAFATDHFEQVRGLVDASGWHRYYAGLAYTSNDPALLEQLVEMRDTKSADEALPFTRVIDTITVRIANTPQQEQAVLGWLAARP